MTKTLKNYIIGANIDRASDPYSGPRQTVHAGPDRFANLSTFDPEIETDKFKNKTITYDKSYCDLNKETINDDLKIVNCKQ